MNKHNPFFSFPVRPHGHEEYYKISLDEFIESENSYLNLLARPDHVNYAEIYSGSTVQHLASYVNNYVGAEYQAKNVLTPSNFTFTKGTAKGTKLFFLYEHIPDDFPPPTTNEIVIKNNRYYYQPAQNITLTYLHYNTPELITGFRVTENFSCKAGWYQINSPINFPTGKTGYIANSSLATASASSNLYVNGSATWIYTQGQWLRYQAKNPLTSAITYTTVLKYINDGGYRNLGYTPTPNFNIKSITDFNEKNLLFEFGPDDIDLSDSTINVGESNGELLRTGMILTFVPNNDTIETVFPTITETKTTSPATIPWPRVALSDGTYFATSPDSTDSKPKFLEFRDYLIKSYYIEKISPTKIKLWPKYDDRVTFGQNQKPPNQFRSPGYWPFGFYDQPYFQNQEASYIYNFSSKGSNYKFYAYRFYEKLPDGTAVIPVSIEGAYPHYETISNYDHGALSWSWLDARYVDLENSRIKCVDGIPNYNREVKIYPTGTRIIVRVASQIQPIAYAARARYAFSENVPVLSGEITVQGIKLFAGDYVLLLGQTDTSKNHLYYVSKNNWYKVTPPNDYYNSVGVNDVADYYNQIALVGVDCSFLNDKKYTVYKAGYTYASMGSGNYITAWEKTDHDGSMETPEFNGRYYDFAPANSYKVSFELKGFSELPKPLIENGIYYLIRQGEYISFATSYENAINGISINLETLGKGILVINTALKTPGAYLEEIVSDNPLITSPLDDQALYLINLDKGKFQLAKSKENALAKIPIKLKLKPNDYFALYPAYSESLPQSSLFTKDQKYFSWDVDNPGNIQFQRPVPKYLSMDACDVPAILASNLTLNFKTPMLRPDSSKMPFYLDNPVIKPIPLYGQDPNLLAINENPLISFVLLWKSLVFIDDFILAGGKTHQQYENEKIQKWDMASSYSVGQNVNYQGACYYCYLDGAVIGTPPTQDSQHWAIDRRHSIVQAIDYLSIPPPPALTQEQINALPLWDANASYGQNAKVKVIFTTPYNYSYALAYIRFSDDPAPSKGSLDGYHWSQWTGQENFTSYSYGSKVIPTTVVPPTTFTVEKFGITSVSSWVPIQDSNLANKNEFKFIHLDYSSNYIDAYTLNSDKYRSYTTTNTQAIINAVVADLIAGVSWNNLKIYKFTSKSSKAYIDAFGFDNDPKVVSDFVNSKVSYYSKGTLSRSYKCTVVQQDMEQVKFDGSSLAGDSDGLGEWRIETNPIFNGRYYGDGGPPVSGWYQKKTFEGAMKCKFTPTTTTGNFLIGQINYSVIINDDFNYKLDSGVDVGIPGRHTNSPYSQPQNKLQTAKITAQFSLNVAGISAPSRTSVWMSEFIADTNYTASADYVFDGTNFVKIITDSAHNSIFPNTFSVSAEQYYFPRTNLILDFDSARHIWKKSFLSGSGSLGSSIPLGLDSSMITSADYEEKNSSISSITLSWNALQKRFQSGPLISENVKFRCEALIGKVPLDKQVYQDRVFNSAAQDFCTVSLFGSPNTWMEFTGCRKLTLNSLTQTLSTYSNYLEFVTLGDLKLSRFVFADNQQVNPHTYGNGMELTYDHPVFAQFSKGSFYNWQEKLNNGYELAIADVSLNRHPRLDYRADMDTENLINQSSNNYNFNMTVPYDGYYVKSVENIGGLIYGLTDISNLPSGQTGYPINGLPSSPVYSIPTVAIVSSTGSGAEIEVTCTEGTYPYGSSGGLPKYYYAGSLKIKSTGRDYNGTTPNRDYVIVTVVPAIITREEGVYLGKILSITPGTPVSYYAWITTWSSPNPLSFSSIYPYRTTGINGKDPVPHIAAPVTIGLIKKISFQ